MNNRKKIDYKMSIASGIFGDCHEIANTHNIS